MQLHVLDRTLVQLNEVLEHYHLVLLSAHCRVTCTVKASCLEQENYHDVLIGCKILVIK